MIPEIRLEFTANSNIRNEAVSLARPLLEIAALQGVKTRERIIRTGQAGEGRAFKKYSKRAIRARRRLGLQTRYKDFKRSGIFWESLKSKLQTPTKASVVFTGKAAKGTRETKKGKRVRMSNAALARMLNKKENLSLFTPTAQEMADIGEYMADRVTSEVITAQALEESAFMLARRTRSAQRRANKAVQALRGRA